MKITFLGWGSLIWDPRNLRITGSWQNDGPFLPIEFARISEGGRLTLVLYPDVTDVQTLWAYADETDLHKAIENLRDREGTSIQRIGFTSIADKSGCCNAVPNVLPRIRQWAEEKRIDAAIWTDLPANFKEKTGMDLNGSSVVEYLRSLKGNTLRDAQDYIQRAPEQIETKIRSKIREEFGWG